MIWKFKCYQQYLRLARKTARLVLTNSSLHIIASLVEFTRSGRPFGVAMPIFWNLLCGNVIATDAQEFLWGMDARRPMRTHRNFAICVHNCSTSMFEFGVDLDCMHLVD